MGDEMDFLEANDFWFESLTEGEKTIAIADALKDGIRAALTLAKPASSYFYLYRFLPRPTYVFLF